MKLFLLLFVFLVSFASCAGDGDKPKFAKSSLVDQSIADAQASFPGIHPVQCSGSNPNHEKECSKKFGKPCKCYNQMIMTRNAQERITLKTVGDKVTYQSVAWASNQRDITKGLPPMKDYESDMAPTYISKQENQYGPLNLYIATWIYSNGRASATATCPQVLVDNKWVEVGSLRNCFINRITIETTVEPLDEKLKKNDKKY